MPALRRSPPKRESCCPAEGGLNLSPAGRFNLPDSPVGDDHVGEPGFLREAISVDPRRRFDQFTAPMKHTVAQLDDP